MSFILSIEDTINGKDITLEVDQNDDFATFLEKAGMKLGYALNLNDITEGKDVSLNDNVYQFFNRTEVETNTINDVVVNDEEEYGDVEFLNEEEENILENLDEFLTVKTNEGSQNEYQNDEKEIKIIYEEGKNDSDEYSQMEYLEEEESDEQDCVDLEILDPSLEDDLNNYDSKDTVGVNQWKLTELEEDFKNSFSELMKNENPDLLDAEKIKPYTKEDLLDMLGGSPERNDENKTDFNIDGLDSEIKDDRIYNMLNRPEPFYKRKQNFLKAKMNLKEKLLNMKKSKLYDKNKTRIMMKRERLKMKIKESLKKSKINKIPDINDPKLSSFDIAMLKRTIRQPYIAVAKMSENQITSITDSNQYIEKSGQDGGIEKNDSMNFNLSLDDSRYLPSKYEDIDNEGVFDYIPDEFSQNTDFNDLLTIRKHKPMFSPKYERKSLKNKERDDVLKAVDGINKMMGIHRKFSAIPTAAKKNRKKIKNINRSLLSAIKREDTELDEHTSYLESVVKSEPIDDEDDEYRPGKDIDWMKTKKTKEKYSCRMCNDNFHNMNLAISHALTHRVAGNPFFPCIICIYAFTTYVELQKHMRKEHVKRKSSKKSPLDKLTSKIKNRPGRKPKFLGTQIEIIDGEEVCDVEILEEWLDDDAEDNVIKKENSDSDCVDVEYLMEDLDAFEEELRQAAQMDFDNDSVVEEEWLLENNDDTPIFSFNNKHDEDSEFKLDEPKSRIKKNKCNICLNIFETPEELSNHICTGVKKPRSPQGSHRCALCGQLFVSRKRLLYHKTFHQIELLEMKLTCQKCPERKFSSELDLFDHINNEHNVDFVCEHPGCDKRFHLRSALRIHSRIHGKKCHECKICGRKFYDIHNLREHNITHLPIKPYQCHICLKFVNRRSRLKMHILSHEAKPVENYVLSCKHCSMAFKDAAEAEKHIEDSTDCSNAILSTIDKSELLAAITKFDDRNDAKMMENIDLMDIEQSDKSKTESTVDDIVNETLAKNGIIDVPLMESDVVNQSLQNNEITDSDMKILLDEAGNVKVMFSNEENTNQYLEQKMYEEKCEDVETHSKSNDELISDIGNGAVKELLDEVEANIKHENVYDKNSPKNACDNYLIDTDMLQVESISENKNIMDMNDVTTIIQTNEIENNYIDNIEPKEENYASQQDGDEVKEENQKEKQKQITAEELLGQLKEISRTFIEAIKTKMVFRCEYCEKAFNTKEALNKHKKCHEGLRNPFICNICNAAFSSFARRTSHKTTHGFFRSQLENNKEKCVVENNDDKFPVMRYYVCQHCNKTFLHWSYLRVHRRQKHGKFTYYFNCRVCGEKFTDSWALNSHRRKLHAETINSKKVSNTSYRCVDCGEGFNKRILFAKHRLDQHGDSSLIRSRNKSGSFSCTLCHKVYQTKIGLEGHLRTHNGGVFLCDLCGNGFALLSGLENHNKRVHLKEVRYSCNECGRNLFSPGELEAHKRCHTGEKPFPCEYCNFSFRTKGSRNEHYRIHTNERPYPCDLCDQSFKRSNAMKNHRLTHTGERRYSCPHCPKLFHVHSNLKSHIKLKHPEQYMLSEFKGNQIDTFRNKANEMSNNPRMNITINDPTQMVVVEDVVIEDESGNTLKQDRLPDLVEYKYTNEDITSHMQYNENNAEYDSKDTKIQIQLVDESNNGHRLLYTVGEESATETDIHLIGGEVRYALVDEIGDEQQHQQYAIIDSDQFSKEVGEQNSLYYS